MKRFIDNFSEKKFDILIIGGGITGAAVAYEAASKGFKVALVEKNDFGGATTSATSKLIHGGLRYLKNLEFGLVRESLRERLTWENIAPNFVYPLPFLIPTYQNNASNKWILGLGMVLYDFLSYDKNQTWDESKKLPNHKTLSRTEALLEEPNLVSENLTGASVYYDCQNIFPERLALAFLKSAVLFGAEVANYAEVTRFIKQNNTIEGVEIFDKLNKKTVTIEAKITINCAGAWADLIWQKVNSNYTDFHHIKRSEGIHFITKKITSTHAVALISQSGRHFMIMPWRGFSLIGTTDHEFKGNPDNYKVCKEAVLELLKDVNDNFGTDKLKYEDIRFVYGGLRPLVDEQTEGSYETSRKYEIFDHNEQGISGFMTVEGGKYTTSRNLAENVIKIVEKKLNVPVKETITNKQQLLCCSISNLKTFLQENRKNFPSFSIDTINYISQNYGKEAAAVFKIAEQYPEFQQVISHDGEILAEVVYAIKNEMAFSLTDIFFRRTGIGTLGKPEDNILQVVVNLTAKLLNWSEEKKLEEVDLLMKRFEIP